MNTMTSFHTRDDLFTCLIHLGYLAYNFEEGTCRIPNKEVRQEWFNAIETEAGRNGQPLEEETHSCRIERFVK